MGTASLLIGFQAGRFYLPPPCACIATGRDITAKKETPPQAGQTGSRHIIKLVPVVGLEPTRLFTVPGF
jgi:hypothetical protein